MKLIDQDLLDEIDLPDTLLWEDEFTWNPIQGSVQWSLAGSLHIQSGTKLKGRDVTIVAPDDEMAWVPKSTVLLLQEKANIADRKFNLVIGSGASEQTVQVRFNHAEKPFEAVPVYRWQPNETTSWYKISMRFIEV